MLGDRPYSSAANRAYLRKRWIKAWSARSTGEGRQR